MAEIDAAGSDPEAMAKLPYLGAVCNEVLRIRPVFPLTLRVLGADGSHGHWRLPAGHRGTPSHYLVHTRPDLYPDPHRFRPERFLERSFAPHEGGARKSGSSRSGRGQPSWRRAFPGPDFARPGDQEVAGLGSRSLVDDAPRLD